MKNYKVVVRNCYSHETRDFSQTGDDAQLAHKSALKQVQFHEDITEMFNEKNELVYHILKGWKE